MPLELSNDLLKLLAKALPVLSKRQLSPLARDLVGVFWGLRTAVLIDSVMLDEGDAQSLANAFGAENTEFSRLIVIHEAISSQTLVVNRLLLAERAKRPTAFIEVGSKTPRLVRSAHPDVCLLALTLLPSQLLQPPSSFAALLETVTSHSADSTFLSLSLPDQSSPLALIPFVGYLLDYAAVYCLDESMDGRNCLGGVELVLCEGFLINSGERHRLLSFSYPAFLADGQSILAGSHVRQALLGILQHRLRDAQSDHVHLSAMQVEVEVRGGIVLDQVAL
ncbi:hypothetical protein JCM21900_002247 [Sporobolomyces salmonicolor]